MKSHAPADHADNITRIGGSLNGTVSWVAVQDHIPKGYVITEKGVFLDKNDPEFISGPCWVSSITRSSNGSEWGLVVHWIDQDGNEQKHAFPARQLGESRSPLVPNLMSMGLKVVPGKEKRLITYLGSFDLPEDFRLRSVSQLGWIENHGNPLFILPNNPIGIGGDSVVFQPEEHSPTTNTMHAQGTLSQWQVHVAEPCLGNPILLFSLCTALAGSLLKYSGLDCGGFHLYGGSSKGKTTSLQVGASVWGCGSDPAVSDESHICRWNTTGNALEATAAAHNDGFLSLDEMGTCDARDFGKVIYDLFGGKGKSRLNKSSILQPQRTWRIMGLSTGEISVLQKIEEDSGRKAKTGQLIRLIDVPIQDGVVHDYHGNQPGKFVNQLKKACGTYFGTAGPAFLGNLIKTEMDITALKHSIQTKVEGWEKDIVDKANLENHQQRVLKRFAVVGAAGELAADFGILPFTKDDIYAAVTTVRDAWLGDDNNQPDAIRGLIAVRDFMQREESRFRDAHYQDGRVRDLVGYSDKGRGLHLFTDQGFKEAVRGFNYKHVLAELDRRGYLMKNDSERLKSRHQINGLGRIRLYAIKDDIFNDECL
ncbi:MAG: DUF927 domain-containing protein [Candidatus Thiodiazotropha endolucinida]